MLDLVFSAGLGDVQEQFLDRVLFEDERTHYDPYSRIVSGTAVGCCGVVSGHVCAAICA